MGEILWKPGAEAVKNTQMTQFTNWLGRKVGTHFADYESLHRWSVEHLEGFWRSFLEYTGICFSQPPDKILDTHAMPGARWFSGMHLNYAENILGCDFPGTAIVYCIEKGENVSEGNDESYGEIRYDELRALVARCARGLKNAGIQQGDRVAGYLANIPEAIVACLACASMGASWSSASPDFGLEALCDRLTQIAPKLIFCSTHYRYSGKTYKTEEVVTRLKGRIPSLQTIVSIPYPVGSANTVGDLSWDDFLAPQEVPPLSFAQVPCDHPLFILFSSGTTGAPKCIVHGTGGTLLQHRKELQLHCDIRPDDFLLFFTTCGWMMWNWQLSALSLGAKVGLYDGNPGYPDLTAIWRVVDQLGVTHFGTSGRYIESCMKKQPPIAKGALGPLTPLRSILYTGSPLSQQGFRWIYETVKKDVHLAGISGGTDIVSCFVLGNPNLPVTAGEIQCKGLGVDVVALDETGKPALNAPGELVCRKPLPSMPVGFLNDPAGQKYQKAYFDVYPGLWRHGDYVQFMPGGGVIIYGRSDTTLNPGGVRIGSAEIYSALDHLAFVAGAVVVGWIPPGQSDEVIVLFVVGPAKQELDEASKQIIRQTIREKCSPRHVPRHIFQISGVPVTRSGKPVELSVKAALAGRPISNRSALANPEVLGEIGQIRTQLLGEYASA